MNKDGSLNKNILCLGYMVSTDQILSALPGLLPNKYRRERESQRYVYGAIFIDEASEYFSLHYQISLVATEAIRYKHDF